MVKKLLLCILALCMACMTTGLQAQELTDDVAFLRVGYQWNTVEFDVSGMDDLENNGVAIEGEYNLNLGGWLLGVSLEWARLVNDDDSDLVFYYLSPMISLKFLAAGGLYIGPGISSRYMMSADTPSGVDEPDKEVDLWVNAVAGWMAPIAEAVYLDVQARFGWNLTKNQFEDVADIDNNYDYAVYVGIGTRTRSTGI
jgi:hypothetical protein